MNTDFVRSSSTILLPDFDRQTHTTSTKLENISDHNLDSFRKNSRHNPNVFLNSTGSHVHTMREPEKSLISNTKFNHHSLNNNIRSITPADGTALDSENFPRFAIGFWSGEQGTHLKPCEFLAIFIRGELLHAITFVRSTVKDTYGTSMPQKALGHASRLCSRFIHGDHATTRGMVFDLLNPDKSHIVNIKEKEALQASLKNNSIFKEFKVHSNQWTEFKEWFSKKLPQYYLTDATQFLKFCNPEAVPSKPMSSKNTMKYRVDFASHEFVNIMFRILCIPCEVDFNEYDFYIPETLSDKRIDFLSDIDLDYRNYDYGDAHHKIKQLITFVQFVQTLEVYIQNNPNCGIESIGDFENSVPEIFQQLLRNHEVFNYIFVRNTEPKNSYFSRNSKIVLQINSKATGINDAKIIETVLHNIGIFYQENPNIAKGWESESMFRGRISDDNRGI